MTKLFTQYEEKLKLLLNMKGLKNEMPTGSLYWEPCPKCPEMIEQRIVKKRQE